MYVFVFPATSMQKNLVLNKAVVNPTDVSYKQLIFQFG